MVDADKISWRGAGRILAFVLGVLLVLNAIPRIFDRYGEAAAGWDIFLGLLIAGAVGSGYRHAPRIALVIVLLMAIRLAVSLWLLQSLSPPVLIGGLFFALSLAVFVDLRRQARAVVVDAVSDDES